ncbi:MAG: hypothetical protein WHT09_12485, partial [Thermogutta sp.]
VEGRDSLRHAGFDAPQAAIIHLCPWGEIRQRLVLTQWGGRRNSTPRNRQQEVHHVDERS